MKFTGGAVWGIDEDDFDPPVLAGRYRGEHILVPGSGLVRDGQQAITKLIWLGTDTETAERVVIKRYYDEREAWVYENERDAHREMIECPRLARMLAHDDEQRAIVKPFISGVVVCLGNVRDTESDPSGYAIPRPDWKPSRVQVRTLLADVLEVVACAARVGRVADHCLGGGGEIKGEKPGTRDSAAEPNVIYGNDGRATVVDVCGIPRGQWRADELAAGAILRALWMHRRTEPRPAPRMLRVANADDTNAALQQIRRSLLDAIDPELRTAIDRNSSSPARLHEAVAGLAG